MNGGATAVHGHLEAMKWFQNEWAQIEQWYDVELADKQNDIAFGAVDKNQFLKCYQNGNRELQMCTA